MNWNKGVFYAPDDTSGGGSGSEPTIEQLKQQVSALQKELDGYKTKVDAGDLVSPKDYLKKQIDAGEVFTKERFVGMQQKFQDEQNARKADKLTFDEQLTKLQTDYDTLTATHQSLTSEAETLRAGTGQKDEEIAKLTKRTTRFDTIFKIAPQLGADEVDGLLPDGEGEEFENKLKLIAERRNLLREEGAREFGSGGGGRQPAGNGAQTEAKKSQVLSNKLTELAVKGDPDNEYDSVYGDYMKALDEEKPQTQ